MYLSPLGALREASNQSVLRWKRYAAKASGLVLKRAASKVEIGPPSNHPERRRRVVAGGASTVDAREKEKSIPLIMMQTIAI
jgi:hypothetical protein